MLPEVFVSVGSKSFRRCANTRAPRPRSSNAYLGPVLAALRDGDRPVLQASTAPKPGALFQSNGGMAIGEAMGVARGQRDQFRPGVGAAGRPVRRRPLGFDNIITVDMGGTSFDITLTQDGVTNISKDIDFLRYRIGVPMIQVETLGAGGGSIAWIDQMGLLQVGPAKRRRRTRARPATAAAATEPTVTDANVVLGYLQSGFCWAAGWRCESTGRRTHAIAEPRRRAARHVGRESRLRHLQHRQQQHGQRHPPRLDRARLRSARFRAGRRRRCGRPAHHRAGRRRWASAPCWCRSWRPACAHSARSSPTSSTTTWRPARCAWTNGVDLTRVEQCFAELEKNAVSALEQDGIPRERIAMQAQHGHALCRASA